MAGGEIITEVGRLAHETDAQVVVPIGATVRAVLSVLEERNVSAAFIIDEIGRLCGSVSYDLLKSSRLELKLENLPALTDGRPTQFIMVDAPVVDAFHLMTRDNVDVLPVVDSDNMLHGFVALNELREHLSPERIYPSSVEGVGMDENVERHIARYRFAAEFIGTSDVVLDGACGAGYGSAIIADKAASVIGIDISEEAINFAVKKYQKKNITFLCEDLARFSCKDRQFDAVVCLETMEHLAPEVCGNFMRAVHRWLKPRGVLVASSPMLRYRNGKPFITNPHHINEMPREALLGFFIESFPGFTVQFFHQKQNAFTPLLDEDSGFCIIVARKMQGSQHRD